MANDELSPSEIEKLRLVFQKAALNGFPNPDRSGCPLDNVVLKAIAAKTLPLTDPAWRHTARCSPCFREVKTFEAEARSASRKWKAGVVIAAVVLVATALLFFRNRFLPRMPTEYQTATLDLRRYTSVRSESEKPGDGKGPVALNRGHLTVSVLLPVGADTGRYEYKLLNDSLQMVLSGESDARMENHMTTLSTKLDTEILPSGHYTFWLRRPGFDWRSYQIGIQ